MRKTERKLVAPSPILSAIHTVIIGTMLNFTGGNSIHGPKKLRVNKPLLVGNGNQFTVGKQ